MQSRGYRKDSTGLEVGDDRSRFAYKGRVGILLRWSWSLRMKSMAFVARYLLRYGITREVWVGIAHGYESCMLGGFEDPFDGGGVRFLSLLP